MPKPRKPPTFKPLRTLRIFCEGEKTEPNYLNGYIISLENKSRTAVVEVQKTRKNTAVQLVQEAIAMKKSSASLPDDEYWVVYDRESKAKYSDNLHARALNLAEKNGINVSLCNVCFEYWILLHLVDTDAPYSSFEDLRKNSALNNEIFRISGSIYEKSVSSIFEIVKNGLSIARIRGERLNQRGVRSAHPTKSEPFHINPYVGIVDLLNAIDGFS
jgi:hypothetical protein